MTNAELLGSNSSSQTVSLDSEFLFFSCVPNNSLLYPWSPENQPFCHLRLRELLPHNWPLSVAHVVSWGRHSHTEHCSYMFRTIASRQKSRGCLFYLSTRTRRLTKKRKRKHKSRGANCLLGALKASIPPS